MALSANFQVFKIPLTNTPQTFGISLANKDYLMTCKWNSEMEGGWVADFVEANSNVPVVANVPLICGVDCLDGLDYLGFEGQLWVFTDGNQFAVPTLENLGIESNLYFATDVVNG